MLVENIELVVTGRLVKTAKLRAEYYDSLEDPPSFAVKLRDARIRADLFTFVQRVREREPKYPFQREWDSIAVLPIATYDRWWKTQISDKTRNMIRKATKKGLEVRTAKFHDDLVQGILEIYNESPIRQGKRFAHYGKDFETVKKDHATYLARSQFIGAFLRDELVGFIKLVHGDGAANLMQIISKMAHRDKAPTNALIAKAVEICAESEVQYLHYGMWSRRGLGAFKVHHGFQRFEVPRYFVPLTRIGDLMLRCHLHHRWSELVPESWIDAGTTIRGKWYAIKYGQETGRGR